jgi:hypothetical protein
MIAERTSWVTCPICGESDMVMRTYKESGSIISCVNIQCASNGGTNMNGINKKNGKTRTRNKNH